MELITTQITILSEIFSSEVSTPHYAMGILLPQDPHPPQKALFCQQIEGNEVVCSIERFDLLAVTTSLKESTKGEIGHWTLSRLSPPLRLSSLPRSLVPLTCPTGLCGVVRDPEKGRFLSTFSCLTKGALIDKWGTILRSNVCNSLCLH